MQVYFVEVFIFIHNSGLDIRVERVPGAPVFFIVAVEYLFPFSFPVGAHFPVCPYYRGQVQEYKQVIAEKFPDK